MIPLRSLVCTIFLVTVIHLANGKSFFTEELQSLGWKKNDPPAPNNEALMARYIVHNSGNLIKFKQICRNFSIFKLWLAPQSLS